jgi:hypothetical protein
MQNRNPERSSRSNPGQYLKKRTGHNNRGHDPERLNGNAHSRNSGKRRNNRNPRRENLKRAEERAGEEIATGAEKGAEAAKNGVRDG